jgi:hypothetical protein
VDGRKTKDAAALSVNMQQLKKMIHLLPLLHIVVTHWIQLERLRRPSGTLLMTGVGYLRIEIQER